MFSARRFNAWTACSVLALAACNPFGRSNAVQMDARDATLNTRWHATLASPATLAGAVQMNGSASMAPSADSTMTIVTIDLANAAPGGLHPWEARRGECGAPTNSAAFGAADAYAPLEVDSDGRAHARAEVQFPTPANGRYFVVVHASQANSRTVVACGNMAAPTR